MRSDQPAIHPADWVTLTRAVLIAGVAGLVADSFGRPVSVTALVTLSTVALVLDAVDGQVARRTGTATPLGARLDGEVDAFLILLLSIYVSQDYGSWVLLIGAARYALLLAGWLIPWLAAPLPPRYWGKVVAAVEGIVLTVAASGLLDRLVGMIAVAAALLLLAESFGRNVIWLYRTGAGPRTRRALRLALTVLSVVLVWGVLVAPDRILQFTPAAFARIPVEGLALVAVAVLLPAWPRRIVAAVAGILFGLLTLVKILNMAFYLEIGRAFNPVFGWLEIPPAIGVVRDTIGPTRTNIALAALCLGLILLVGAITAATIHITTVAARHRRDAVRGLAALTAVWALCAGLSLQLVQGSPVASTSAAGLAVAQVRDTQAALRDQRRFEQALHRPDPEASVPAADLLTGLRGKDVIIDFVESYGQGRRSGHEFLPRRRRRPAPEHRLTGPRRLVHAERLDHLPRLRRDQPAFPLHPAVGAVGQHRTTVCRPGHQPPVHPQRRLRQGRLAHRERQPRGRPRLAARHAVLSLRQALQPVQRRLPAARPSATPRCPTSTPTPSSSGTNSPQATSP